MQYVYSGILWILWYYITCRVLSASDWRWWDACGWGIMRDGKLKGQDLFLETVLVFA